MPPIKVLARIKNMISLNDEQLLDLSGRLYVIFTLVAVVAGALALLASEGIRRSSANVSKLQNDEMVRLRAATSESNEQAEVAKAQAATANSVAETAKANAAEATATAEKLKKENLTIKADISKQSVKAEVLRNQNLMLSKTVEEQKRSTEQLKRGNLKLESSLEQEKLKRLEIERDLAPRSLTEKQIEVIKRVAGSRPGRLKIDIIKGDSDGYYFRVAVARTFRECGWEVPAERDVEENSPFPIEGLRVRTFDPNDPDVRLIYEALEEAGFPVMMDIIAKPDLNRLRASIVPRDRPDIDAVFAFLRQLEEIPCTLLIGRKPFKPYTGYFKNKGQR